ncbi:MAG: hypothetical protein U0791_22420 [Gemmataceae bacterium]
MTAGGGVTAAGERPAGVHRGGEKRAVGGGESADASPELASWLTWAREQGDRLDPVPDTRDPVFGDPQTHSANVVPNAATAS